MPNPLFAKPLSVASTPSIVMVLTSLASPAAALPTSPASPSASPERVGRTRTTWFIVGANPSFFALSVTVPLTPGKGTKAADPVSAPFWSRCDPFGLLKGFQLFNAPGPAALTSSVAPSAFSVPETSQDNWNEPPYGTSRKWPGLESFWESSGAGGRDDPAGATRV